MDGARAAVEQLRGKIIFENGSEHFIPPRPATKDDEREALHPWPYKGDEVMSVK